MSAIDWFNPNSIYFLEKEKEANRRQGDAAKESKVWALTLSFFKGFENPFSIPWVSQGVFGSKEKKKEVKESSFGEVGDFSPSIDLKWDMPNSPLEEQARSLPEAQLNFQNCPGNHTILSPIVGTRADELKAVRAKIEVAPILADLEEAIYQFQLDCIIPLDKKDEADAIAEKIFGDYISKYTTDGITKENVISWITEENILDWIDEEETEDYSRMNVCRLVEEGGQESPWHLKIFAVQRILDINEHYGHYVPPYIAAYHEVMHAEEVPKGAGVDHNDALGIELLTTTKTLILLDLVYKKVHNLSKNEVVDYGKSINLRGKLIPLGEFVNFYRKLERKQGSLAEALISSKSLTYLHKGIEKKKGFSFSAAS